jgi:hypothetical protein
MNTTSSQLINLSRIQHVSQLMDAAFKIPIFGLKFGWDSILGLVL